MEASEGQLASLQALAASVTSLTGSGVEAFQQSGDAELVGKFSALASASEDSVCEGGVTFQELGALLTQCFSSTDSRSQTL